MKKLGELYQKIEKFITNICYDFQLMEKHMKEISESFSQLSLLFLDIENKCNINVKDNKGNTKGNCKACQYTAKNIA